MAKKSARDRFRKWREEMVFTYEMAGAAVGLSREYVRRIELGHVRPMGYETRQAIEAATGIEMSAWENKP